MQAQTLPHDAAAGALRFLLAAGCDVPVLDVPRDWLAEPVMIAQPVVVADAPARTPAPAPAPASARTADPAAPHPALACGSVAALLELLGRFPDAKRRPPLLYDGALESRIWVLIDRPEATGAHRETIDRMLAAIGLDWSRAALVSRLPWPTPGDGEPTPALLTRFTPVLARLAALAPPTHVLALGQLAAEMGGADARLTSSRGGWFDWNGARLLASIHPRTFHGKRDLREQALAHLKLFRADLA